MLSAAATVERSHLSASNRNFWRVVLAFFDALRHGVVASDVYTKRLLARLNLQLRKTIDESAPVADRLFKDTLFALASVPGGSAGVQQVRQVYGLAGMVPADYESPRYGRNDQRTLRDAREALVQAKIAWDKVVRGNRAEMAAVGQAFDAFLTAAEQLPGAGMQALAQALVATRRALDHGGESPSDAQSLEVATAILFAEQVLDQGGRAGHEYDVKAGSMAERLRLAMNGAVESHQVPDWLLALSRAAQERLTMATFIGESLTNLRGVEKELDAYFRDHAKRQGLPETIRQLHQVAGALDLLGHADAAAGAKAVAARVAVFAESEPAPDQIECERVAASLGALGFYVEGLQQPDRPSGRFEFDRASGEFRARLGESPKARRAAEQASEGVSFADLLPPMVDEPAAVSIESELAGHTQLAGGLLTSLQQAPQDEQVRGQLRQALERVRDDAMLLDDGDLKKRAVAAISLLGDGSAHGIEELTAALAEMGTHPTLPAAQPEQPPRDDAAIDHELLEIFLSEADEVLDAIGRSVHYSREAPSDEQFLTTIRRGFHTLKGSSRMVGLLDFGEAGWAMEQVLNLWLAEERPGSADLYGLVEAAGEQMTDWVESLKADPAARVDPVNLIAAADAFRAGDVDQAQFRAEAGRLHEGAAIDRPALLIDEPASDEPAIGDEAIGDELIGEPAIADDVISDDAIGEQAIGELAIVEPAVDEPAISDLAIDEPTALVDDRSFASVVMEIDELAPQTAPDMSIDLSGFSDDIDAVLAEFIAEDVNRALQPAIASDTGTPAAGSIEAAEPPAFEIPLFAELVAGSIADPIAGSIAEPAAEPITEPIVEPIAELALAAHSPAVHEDTAGSTIHVPTQSSDVVQVGELSVSRPLYVIFLGEADELIATLNKDFDDWRAHPARNASERAMRAVHSLAGSASVVGLAGVHSIAEQLETVYQIQYGGQRRLSPDDLAVIAQVIERLQAMLHQFAAGTLPRDEPVALAAVTALVSKLQSTARSEPIAPRVDDHPAAQPLSQPAIQAAIQPAIQPAAIQPAATRPATAAELETAGDELDSELLPIFVEEATDHLPAIGETLRRWADSPADATLPQRLMRALHTVKGSARMAGAMALGQRVHEMETRIEALAILPSVPRDLIEDLITDHDHVMAMFEAIKSPRRIAPVAQVAAPPTAPEALAAPAVAPTSRSRSRRAASSDAIARAASAGAAAARPAEAPIQPQAVAAGMIPASAGPAMPAAAAAASVPATAAAPGAMPAGVQLVRVRSDVLDRLVNQAGEVSIARSKLDNELTGMRQSLADLTENVSRLRTQLREIEIQAETQIQARIAQQKEHERAFDPLEFDRYTRFQELTRMLAESVNDVATVQQNAARNLDEAASDLHRQGQVLRDLQQDLMRVRMVQFGSISDRLFRVVRQAAKDTGKRVNLDMRGTAVEVDRGVLERMAGPIEHLLRNAVAHGIESRESRVGKGKSETGEISVEVRQEGNEVVLTFADDGGGLNLDRIRARGRELGLIAESATPSDRELTELIFAPGFSTASTVTEVSGRGVGLDVVRAETASLGGRIDSESTAAGTRFTIHLPLTLAVAQVVLVGVAGHRYAIPSSSVEQVLQLKPQALAAAYSQGFVEWQSSRVPLYYLGALVEIPDQSPVAQHYSPIVVVRSGTQRIALHVDVVTRNQEVVVKNVGPQVARVRGVAGATVLGSGEIVLIINPVALAQAAGAGFDLIGPASGLLPPTAIAMPRIVMVVDDSLTVRKVTSRLLTREGYQVVLAKDGVDALRQLQDTIPDVMLVDIEMPRMDGFDLTRNVRADERYRHIPIVIITSRTADKHRDYAMSLGVNAYLGKPYGEEELLAQIAGFIEGARSAKVAR